MDKNKSIDGLTIRRPRNQTAPATTSKNSQPLVSKSAKSIKSTRTTSSQSKKPRAKSKSTPKSKTSTSSKSTKTNSISTSSKLITANSTTSSSQATTKPQSATESTAPQVSAEDFLSPIQTFDFDENTGELQASSIPSTPTKQPKKLKKEKKPISKKRKIIISIILVIVGILIATVIGFIIWGNDILARIGTGGNIFDLFSEHYEPLKTDANGRTNILAFGTSGYDMEGAEGNGTHDGAQLTDSIMVISLDQESGDLAMLSLPRDLKVSRTCTATGKVNEIYWCNNMNGDNEQAGAEALMAEVSDILGIDFQYYAHLNWGSLVQIVDTLGGITVTLDEDIEDYYYTKAVFKADTPYTINGAEALGLARARHGTASGDFSRGASQQKILLGIKDRVTEKGLSLTDLLGLANTLGDNLRTSFNVDEMKTLAHLAGSFDFNNIRQVSLIEPEPLMTTSTINGISYVIPAGGTNYYTKIQEYVAKMFSSDPRKYEDPSILILNGTDIAGLASTEQEALESDNYETIYVDDAPIGEYPNQYTLYALTEDKPGTKKLLEEKYSTTALPTDQLPVGIDTTCDFVLILGDSPSTTSSETE